MEYRCGEVTGGATSMDGRSGAAWVAGMSMLLLLVGLGGASVGLGGCFAGGKAAVQHYYELPAEKGFHKGGRRGDVVVRVEEFDTVPAYDALRLAYRVSPYEIRYYGVRQWVSKPGLLVASALRRALEASGRFRLVTEESTPVADYSVTGQVVAIEEVDHGPKKGHWYAHLALRIVVRHVSDGKIVWRGTFDRLVAVRRRRPVAVVAGLTKLVQAAAREIISRIEASASTVSSSVNPGN